MTAREKIESFALKNGWTITNFGPMFTVFEAIGPMIHRSDEKRLRVAWGGSFRAQGAQYGPDVQPHEMSCSMIKIMEHLHKYKPGQR